MKAKSGQARGFDGSAKERPLRGLRRVGHEPRDLDDLVEAGAAREVTPGLLDHGGAIGLEAIHREVARQVDEVGRQVAVEALGVVGTPVTEVLGQVPESVSSNQPSAAPIEGVVDDGATSERFELRLEAPREGGRAEVDEQVGGRRQEAIARVLGKRRVSAEEAVERVGSQLGEGEAPLPVLEAVPDFGEQR